MEDTENSDVESMNLDSLLEERERLENRLTSVEMRIQKMEESGETDLKESPVPWDKSTKNSSWQSKVTGNQ